MGLTRPPTEAAALQGPVPWRTVVDDQVHGGDVRCVVTQEGAPSLGRRSTSLDHVLFVWTGRAVQAGCDDLEIIGLAHLYSAH